MEKYIGSESETVAAKSRERVKRLTAGPSIMSTDLGPILLAQTDLYTPMVEYFGKRLDDLLLAPKPPEFAQALKELGAEKVALCVVVPWIDEVYAELEAKKRRRANTDMLFWKRIGGRVRDVMALEAMLHSSDEKAQAAAERIKKGNRRTKLDYSFLKEEWSNEQLVKIGRWLWSVLEDGTDIVGKGGEIGTLDDWRKAFADAR